MKRIPLGGWKRCVHEAAAFDTQAELHTGRLLDSSTRVEWWLRNDPPIFRIPTSIGFFEPDFLAKGQFPGGTSYLVLEVKGELFWDGEGSDARIKAAAMVAWINAIHHSAHNEKWLFCLSLEQDVLRCKTLDEILTTDVSATR